MRELIATKSLTYATRRLKAGDYFTAHSNSDANVLVTIGNAKRATKIDVNEPALQDDDLPTLRVEYERMFGKRPFMGWDANKLREKLSEVSDRKD